ncbi:MAG: acyl carrier protein [Bacilli bacterium]|nr:acyl carrier protein [Bacilli bacterium]MBR1582023.1 acyl carrier protein [Bacilli bacterium]
MYERLLKIIKENVPNLDVSKVTEDSLLVEDLGMDSIAMLMMSMSIEDEFGITFDDLVVFKTVKDVLNYLNEHATK